MLDKEFSCSLTYDKEILLHTTTIFSINDFIAFKTFDSSEFSFAYPKSYFIYNLSFVKVCYFIRFSSLASKLKNIWAKIIPKVLTSSIKLNFSPILNIDL